VGVAANVCGVKVGPVAVLGTGVVVPAKPQPSARPRRARSRLPRTDPRRSWKAGSFSLREGSPPSRLVPRRSNEAIATTRDVDAPIQLRAHRPFKERRPTLPEAGP
jgi:hypothetical protein